MVPSSYKPKRHGLGIPLGSGMALETVREIFGELRPLAGAVDGQSYQSVLGGDAKQSPHESNSRWVTTQSSKYNSFWR